MGVWGWGGSCHHLWAPGHLQRQLRESQPSSCTSTARPGEGNGGPRRPASQDFPLQTKGWKPKALADSGVCSVLNLNFVSICICIYIEFYVSSDDSPRCWVSPWHGLVSGSAPCGGCMEARPGPSCTNHPDWSLHLQVPIRTIVRPRALPFLPPLWLTEFLPHNEDLL